MGAGRPKNIQTTEDLWELFQEYIHDLKTKEAEWLKIQYVGKEGTRETDELKLPLTFEGFKRYCWDVEVGCIEQYFTNQDKLYAEYIGVCSRIKNHIRENQITGGLLNVFNPSITQRLNNIKEQTDITSGGNSIQSTELKVNIVRPTEDED